MKSASLVNEKEINVIRGKIMVGKASLIEIKEFLLYVSKLEEMVEEASMEDFYGTEGWKRRMGWDS